MAHGDGALVRTPSWTGAVEQARFAVRALLHGEDAPEYRPASYFWTAVLGLDDHTPPAKLERMLRGH